jgi:hypothetical protein
MAKRTFRERVTSGSVIASAPVEEAQFQRIITNINKQFRLNLVASKETYEPFHDRIRIVSGHFWLELEPVNRKTVLERLNRLTKNIRSVKAQLSPLRGGFQEWAEADTEVVNLLVHAVDLAHAGQHPRPREQLQISLKVIDGLEDTCERALVLLSELPARRGQPRLGWYDELVSLMLRVADFIGIKVSTAGDRSEDPYATPFTVLVFEAERVLQEEAWSPNLAACAKRIDRSLKRLKGPVRQNSRKTG